MDNKEKEFEKLVRKHKSTIYTVCYMFSDNNDEVADLFQDILIKLWMGYSSFREESALSTWIWRVSVNTCISAERKKKNRHTVPLSVDIDPFEESGKNFDQIQRLHSRIHRLGLLDRAIVLLWLEDLSYEEIGAIIGISAGNVAVKLFRIKEQLQKMSNDQ